MFTINIYLRFALIGVFLIGGIALSIIYGFWYAFPLMLIGLILLVGYVLFGTVQSAALMIQTMNIDGAERRLNLTLNPKWLFSFNRAYYYMVKGTIATQRKNMDDAEKYFEMAQEAGLPGANEQAMILMQQANIAGTKGRWTVAKSKMREIKKLKITEQALKDQIKELDRAIAQSGRIKGAQRQGAFGMKGMRKMKR